MESYCIRNQSKSRQRYHNTRISHNICKEVIYRCLYKEYVQIKEKIQNGMNAMYTMNEEILVNYVEKG